MASRRKPRKTAKRRKRAGRRSGFGQRLLVTASAMILVLCAASITHGFFFRKSAGAGGNEEFRIEVLNGTGTSGLAQAATLSLRRRGIDVVETGNADRFSYEHSVLIARKKGADVEKLGKILSCRNVVEQLRKGTLEDATLILGADYRELSLDWDLESDPFE